MSIQVLRKLRKELELLDNLYSALLDVDNHLFTNEKFKNLVSKLLFETAEETKNVENAIRYTEQSIIQERNKEC